MKIDVDFDNITKIAHLSDIHIRLFKRHGEYRKSFETLYKQLREKLKDENGVIVVAGDIIHTKLDLSPESVGLVSDFFKNLAKIAPTVVIAGNHDCNLANSHRLDSLTPIIKNIDDDNLHYFRNSGVYTIADTDFFVFSILDDRSKWPSPDEGTSKNKVALYHGPVYGAITDTNFVISNRHISTELFDGFDVVMLGDIHRYQVLQLYDPSNKKPSVVYSSSLIQQNHGESLDGHGWCLWNMDTKSHNFIQLPNEYGYVTVEISDEKLTLPKNTPQNIRLRLFTGNLENSKVKKIIALIKRKHKILELNVNPNRLVSIGSRSSVGKFDIGDLSNVNVQNVLLEEWITKKHIGISDEVIQEVMNINAKINSMITLRDQSRNVYWKPKKFTFSNLFSFGEDNVIDFDDLSGSNGIFAPNATGKSASMDALIFTLFDKTPRAFKGDHIMNSRKDTFQSELKFEIDGTIFHIKRTGTRKTNGAVKVDVDFWRINENGAPESLNGEDRFSTNNNIRNVVGTYEDFILTTLSGQFGNSLFIDKSNTERKNLLNQFMGLDVFEHLYLAANEQSKELQIILKKFNREDFTTKLTTLQSDIEKYTIELGTYQTVHDTLVTQIDTLEKKVEELLNSKLYVPVIDGHPIAEMEVATTKLKRIEAKDAQIKENIGILTKELETIQSEIVDVTSQLSAFDKKELGEKVTQYMQAKSEVDSLSLKLTSLSNELVNKNNIHNNLLKFKYNEDCDICVTNNKEKIDQLSAINTQISSLTKSLSNVESSLKENQVKMDELSPYYSKSETFDILTDSESALRIQFDKLKTDIQKYTSQLRENDIDKKDIVSTIELIQQYEENIVYNNKIDDEVLDIRSKIRINKNKLTEVQSEQLDIHSNKKVCENSRSEIIKELQKISEIESEFNAYKYYLESVSRDGLPYNLISKAIPNIELEINNILSQIINFTVALDVDGKNFGGRIVYDADRSWPLENSSGMERFISSLAIRVALLKASNLPKSNFLIIDEGMGSLDAENLHGIQTLFNILKNEFEFLVIISHLDVIRDMVDTSLEITVQNGYSYINTQMT